MGAGYLTEPAPEGTIWVCGACGKTSPTKSGYGAQWERLVRNGWDASCMLHAVLCRRLPDGTWEAVDPQPAPTP